jgi:predicted dehydrogenase/nucleoside-diphosphate-sugar epimerase
VKPSRGVDMTRVGIIGCGAVAQNLHIPAVSQIPHARLTAVVDSNVERAREAAARYASLAPGKEPPGSATSIDEAFLDAVDVAIITTPPSARVDLAMPLLSAGKHLLIEKPMARTVEECQLITRRAQEVDAVVGVSHIRRLLPAALWIKSLLQEQRLGEVRSISWREGVMYDWPATTPASFRRDSAGGGVLMDLGPHVLDLLLWWMGPDVRVQTCTHNSLGGVESDVRASLQFGSVDAEVELSWIRTLPNVCKVRGDEGIAEVHVRDVLSTYRIESTNEDLLESGRFTAASPGGESFEQLFVLQLQRFIEAATVVGVPYATGEDGCRAVALINECYTTAEARPDPWVQPQSPRRELPRLSDVTVAVTGATGFIGSRTVERLVLETAADIVALARSYSRLPRLATLPEHRVRFEVASLEDIDALAEALRGCDVVVHTAYGTSGTLAERRRTTVDGTRNTVLAAKKAGCRRVIHISSMVVYQGDDLASFDETTPYVRPSEVADDYVSAKLAAEKLAFNENDGIEVVVLQPTVVYGPWCPAWTIRPIGRVALDSPILPTGRMGVCNAVYVDDVAEAIILAIGATEASGEKLLISGSSPVTWGEFYDAFRQIVPYPSPLPTLPPTQLPEIEQRLYTNTAVARIERAKRLLGFDPKFDFEEGMHLVDEWLRWMGDPLVWNFEFKWRYQSSVAAQELTDTVPPGSTFILIDDDHWRALGLGDASFKSRRVIHFNEREGQYWGAPSDDAAAVQELVRLREEGGQYVAFTWPVFWWLEYYQNLAAHLRSSARCIFDNDRLLVFEFDSAAG